MKVKLLLVLFLFIFQFGFPQTGKFLKGIVSSDNLLMHNVDIINKTSKQFTKTNEKGEFVITVKESDSLFFYSKNFYLKKLKVSSQQLEQTNLVVVMFAKPEELKEVVITKMESIKLGNNLAYEKGKRDEIDLKKAYDATNNRTVYDGFMDNAMQIILKEKSKKITVEIEFATLAKKTCESTFFTNNLKLKQDEIELFLQFCDADSKSEKLKTHTNVLSMMDFLAIKNMEFQKVKGIIK